jgi:hypothetical protein
MTVSGDGLRLRAGQRLDVLPITMTACGSVAAWSTAWSSIMTPSGSTCCGSAPVSGSTCCRSP